MMLWVNAMLNFCSNIDTYIPLLLSALLIFRLLLQQTAFLITAKDIFHDSGSALHITSSSRLHSAIWLIGHCL